MSYNLALPSVQRNRMAEPSGRISQSATPTSNCIGCVTSLQLKTSQIYSLLVVADCDGKTTVWRQRHFGDLVGMLHGRAEGNVGMSIPKACRLVIASSQNGAAVVANAYFLHDSVVLVNKFFIASASVPDANALVTPNRNRTATIAAERGSSNVRLMLQRMLPQFAPIENSKSVLRKASALGYRS